MNLYAELREQAKAKRDRAIRAVRDEYQRDLMEITKLANKLVGRPRKRPHSTRAVRARGDVPFCELYISEAISVVLRDSAMTLTELTLEIQRRSCRQHDDPRKVMHAVRGSLLYHRVRYRRVKAGRWGVVSLLPSG